MAQFFEEDDTYIRVDKVDPSIVRGLIGDVDQIPKDDNDNDKIFPSPLSYESCEVLKKIRIIKIL